MPRTRSDQGREAKRDEIVAAAGERLRSAGYDGLSVSALARELGVAQNSIYWYFPSKDHLFVAVLERMLAAVAAGKPTADAPIDERVLWFTDRFAPVWDHSEALHRRREHAEVVADLAARLDAVITTMLGNALRDGVGDADLPLACETFRTVVEGTYARRLPTADRHRVLRHVLGLMRAAPRTPAAPSPPSPANRAFETLDDP